MEDSNIQHQSEMTKIEDLGIEHVLKRGTGEIIYQDETLLLVKDSVSRAFLLTCGDKDPDIEALDEYLGKDCDLLVVSNQKLADAVFERYGFSGKDACYQVAYFGEKPPADPRITVRVADESDLPMFMANYDMLNEEERKRVVERGSLLLGYDGDQLVGFIGEHMEGSIGMLYVFPNCRRRGYATALENELIARTMERGFVPFGQVLEDNEGSLLLQKKIGMTQADDLIVWMWREEEAT
jgi:Acetyltransferases